jgi:enamine deaminase RidA (YjgF/YER057c/UK114 family)
VGARNSRQCQFLSGVSADKSAQLTLAFRQALRTKLGWGTSCSSARLQKEQEAMVDIDRRTVFVAGFAAASLTSNTSAIAQQAAAGSAEARLRELGIELPKALAPVANYVPAARLGNLIFLAGLPPVKPDGKFATGKVGIDVTLDEAYQHARLVGIGLLAVMRQELGSLDKLVRVGRVFGMVNAAPNFTDHPKVINGCSDLFVEVFGDRGRHARCAVGMASLPFNISVEIEAVVEVA